MNCSFVYFLIEKAEEKYKTADGKVNGKTKSVKHHLSPTNILFKFSMGVVEYLRLEGKMKHEQRRSSPSC